MESYDQAYKNKRILITGGLGFIGSNLAHRLVELGTNQVLLVDSMSPNQGGNLFNINGIESCVRVSVSDLCDYERISCLVQGVDYLFNLAGQVSHIDSMTDPYADLEANCRAHLTLLEACRKNNPRVKIVFSSTRQIYGKPNYLPVDERHLKHPTDVNGIHKMAAERYHIVYNDVYGVRSVCLRLTNTYGPRQLVKHHRQGVASWFIRKAIDGEEISIFGDGTQLRDFTYVDDVLDALLRAAACDTVCGGVFNLGGHQPISLINFAKLLIRITGRGSYKLVPFPAGSKCIDIGDYYADYTKIRTALGWRPKVCLEEGLMRTVEFYRQYRHKYWS